MTKKWTHSPEIQARIDAAYATINTSIASINERTICALDMMVGNRDAIIAELEEELAAVRKTFANLTSNESQTVKD